MREWMIGSEFQHPPCFVPLSDLAPISLDQVRIFDQAGMARNCIIVRTFTQANYDRYLCAGIEDVHGNVGLVILHNTDPTLKPEQVLPKGLVFAIKQPLCLIFSDGKRDAIVIDHPSDMVEVGLESPLMPSAFKQDLLSMHGKDPINIKTEGNRALLSRDYPSAVRLYSMAIALCGPQDQRRLRCDLFRNRSLANNYLGRFQKAQEDAAASLLESTDEESRKLDSKAYLRMGRASYQLGQFEAALGHFTKASQLNPQEKEVSEALTLVGRRLHEQEHGEYRLDSWIALLQTQNSGRVDAANFVKNTKVENFPRHGRGLAATKDIKPGGLVMVEKAFIRSPPNTDYREAKHTNIVPDLDRGRTMWDTASDCVSICIQKMVHNPCIAAPVLGLSSVQNFAAETVGGQVVDGQTVVNSYAVASIWHLNRFWGVFGLMDPNAISMHTLHNQAGNYKFLVRGALINHSCVPNATYGLMGDMMVVHAIKPIKKGEEITISYLQLNVGHPEGRFNLLQSFGFVCDCALCTADAACSSTSLTVRQDLRTRMEQGVMLEVTRTVMAADEYTWQLVLDVMDRFRPVYEQMEATYDAGIYGDNDNLILPRPNLAEAGMFVIVALDGLVSHILVNGAKKPPKSPQERHVAAKGHQMLLDLALQAMRNSGVKITMKDNQELQVDFSASISCGTLHQAARMAAWMVQSLGKDKLWQKFVMLYYMNYKTYFGSLHGVASIFGETLPDPALSNYTCYETIEIV